MSAPLAYNDHINFRKDKVMNQKMKIGAIIAVIIVLGVGAFALTNNKSDKKTDSEMASHESTPVSSKSETSNKTTDTNMITYKNFAVVQKTIRIKKGTTVTWTNQDAAKHDVTPDTETADFKATELFGKGESKSITFNTVGTFAYHCSPHPYMKGTVEVTD